MYITFFPVVSWGNKDPLPLIFVRAHKRGGDLFRFPEIAIDIGGIKPVWQMIPQKSCILDRKGIQIRVGNTELFCVMGDPVVISAKFNNDSIVLIFFDLFADDPAAFFIKIAEFIVTEHLPCKNDEQNQDQQSTRKAGILRASEQGKRLFAPFFPKLKKERGKKPSSNAFVVWTQR